MPTIVEVHAAIKARLAANFTAIPLRYKNDRGNPIPDKATAFGVVDIVLDPPAIISFGSGRGGNLQRTAGSIRGRLGGRGGGSESRSGRIR